MIWNRSIMILSGMILLGATLVAAAEPIAQTNEVFALLEDLCPPNQHDFRIVFDDKGLILEVQDVIHKQ